MPRKVSFVVERADRLDRAVAVGADRVSRRQARALIDAGAVFVDGRRCRVASRRVPAGARVVAHLSAPDALHAAGQTTAVEPAILWQSGDLFAVDKPPGIHVNETETSPRPSVVSLFDGPVFLVHRLDRETSGVLLLARTAAAASGASALFERRAVEKTYWAVTQGVPSLPVVDAPIGADRRRPRAKAVREGGKSACTRLEVLGAVDGLAGVRAFPETGRTHQVRVHLTHVSSPIAGDVLYGGPAASRLAGEVVRWPRIMLHAAELGFTWEGEDVWLSAPCPPDFEGLERLGLPPPPAPRSLVP